MDGTGLSCRCLEICRILALYNWSIRSTKHHHRTTIEDAKRWADKYNDRVSILRISREEGVDPETVSIWLRRIGIEFKQGHHFVAQPPLAYSKPMTELLSKGERFLLNLIKERTWEIRATEVGVNQLSKFCQFLVLYNRGKGVVEIARDIKVHRSSVSAWRDCRDQPYLVRVLLAISGERVLRPGWRFVPTRLSAGANEPREWIQVPPAISEFSNIIDVISQLPIAPEAFARASRFGVADKLAEIRPELIGYAMGMMVGDAGKLGGQQSRVRSMNIDIQLSRLEPSNEELGEFASLCFNALGVGARRIKDKEPSGTQLSGRRPTPAFRWASDRSPLLAWVFSSCLGLNWGENTSTNPVKMEWIHGCPRTFRRRFVQAIADSDGSVKRSGVVITSVPNADFITKVLKGLGLNSAHTLYENGKKLRTYVSSVEAASLPVFNEIVQGYRYEQLRDQRKG